MCITSIARTTYDAARTADQVNYFTWCIPPYAISEIVDPPPKHHTSLKVVLPDDASRCFVLPLVLVYGHGYIRNAMSHCFSFSLMHDWWCVVICYWCFSMKWTTELCHALNLEIKSTFLIYSILLDHILVFESAVLHYFHIWTVFTLSSLPPLHQKI